MKDMCVLSLSYGEFDDTNKIPIMVVRDEETAKLIQDAFCEKDPFVVDIIKGVFKDDSYLDSIINNEYSSCSLSIDTIPFVDFLKIKEVNYGVV